MATLVIKSPGAETRSFPLVKPLTSVGPSPDCDVRIGEMGRGLVTIQFDGARFTATALDGATLEVNGRRRDRHQLADGDALGLGRVEIVFEGADRVPEEAAAVEPSDLAVRRLAEFTAALAGESDTERALTRLLDSIIEVTKADKGFLIVLEEGAAQVVVARNLDRQPAAEETLSDSIVQRVVQSKEPLIVSDAVHDPRFMASESVVSLKLSSVMCAPLVRRGELFGAVYVGNDRIASLFTDHELLLMKSFCSTATLMLERALEFNELRSRVEELQTRLEEERTGDIVGSCEALKDVFKKIDKIAPTDIGVLVTGETGTGKELVAREIHRKSQRKSGPFVAINCGAIPETLLESELFGYVKGAFTGAAATRGGRFQAASGGTLLLDEIGEMPPLLQVKLLRALQEKAVVKVGDTRPEPVDIRIVAATNKDLDEEMRAGRFREDLYYRINVVRLHLPPLRERGEDAAVLAKWFLGRAVRELGSKVKGLSKEALVAIKRYRWPGNIRQLENRLKKAVVLADGPLITPDDLELKPEQLEPILPLGPAREEWQKRYINEVLERNGGNRTKTAKDLGVDPRTIFRHLERLEAERRGEKLPDEPPAEGEP